MSKKRLDVILVEKELAPTRHKAQALIMAGEVLVDGKPGVKAGAAYSEDAEIRIRGTKQRYVSRGGDKLEGALEAFGVSVAGLDGLDVGASTGGFTDCLLQRGARSVCTVDVGRGQLDLKLRNDPRVTVREKMNARGIGIGDFGREFDIIVVDVSFISLLKVLPALRGLLKSDGAIIALVKPQFEAGRGKVGKGGVVRDPKVHEEVLSEVIRGASGMGLFAAAVATSVLTGPKGNIEFFLLLKKEPPADEGPSPLNK
jgi:23S rRNA (cytidine1920-2'-O)/16S rRNA (cytidine1409-2'-O)-methyltransferase